MLYERFGRYRLPEAACTAENLRAEWARGGKECHNYHKPPLKNDLDDWEKGDFVAEFLV